MVGVLFAVSLPLGLKDSKTVDMVVDTCMAFIGLRGMLKRGCVWERDQSTKLR